MNNQPFFEEVHKDEAFQAILKQIENAHNSKVKRIPRTAQHEGKFYFTVLLTNYELLEVTITAGRLGHMAALECEVEVY
jgi:hypothetical protein